MIKKIELLKQTTQLIKQGTQILDEFIALNAGEPKTNMVSECCEAQIYVSADLKEHCTACEQYCFGVNISEPKQSEVETIKEKYATGHYVCYFDKYEKWQKLIKPHFDDRWNYKLIHKKDAHIAEAVAKDSGVEVKIETLPYSPFSGEIVWKAIDNFFESYHEKNEYHLHNHELVFEEPKGVDILRQSLHDLGHPQPENLLHGHPTIAEQLDNAFEQLDKDSKGAKQKKVCNSRDHLVKPTFPNTYTYCPFCRCGLEPLVATAEKE
jgi:hypothetical protein